MMRHPDSTGRIQLLCYPNRQRMTLRFVLLFLAVLLLSALRVQADVIPSEEIPNFIKTSYSISEGLPTDEANAVVQDHAGRSGSSGI